jgi:hypothetical protein
MNFVREGRMFCWRVQKRMHKYVSGDVNLINQVCILFWHQKLIGDYRNYCSPRIDLENEATFFL